MEEDESPPIPRPVPQGSPRLSPRPSQSTGSGSAGVSPRLGIVSRAVSLARRASSSGGVRKWQLAEKKGRSLSVSVASAIPALSRTDTARLQSLLFSPSDDLPRARSQNNSFIEEITTRPLSGAPLSYSQEDSTTLSALNVPLTSLPAPSSPMIPPFLSLGADVITRGNPIAQCTSTTDVTVPDLLQKGTPMIKVSGRKQKNVVVRLDHDQGQIIWESKKHRISASFLDGRQPH